MPACEHPEGGTGQAALNGHGPRSICRHHLTGDPSDPPAIQHLAPGAPRNLVRVLPKCMAAEGHRQHQRNRLSATPRRYWPRKKAHQQDDLAHQPARMNSPTPAAAGWSGHLAQFSPAETAAGGETRFPTAHHYRKIRYSPSGCSGSLSRLGGTSSPRRRGRCGLADARISRPGSLLSTESKRPAEARNFTRVAGGLEKTGKCSVLFLPAPSPPP